MQRYTLGDSGDFQTSRYQSIVKATASGVFEDLKFKISEGSNTPEAVAFTIL